MGYLNDDLFSSILKFARIPDLLQTGKEAIPYRIMGAGDHPTGPDL